jgi:hypothetical protein
MTDQPPEQEGQPPVAQCPLQTCDWEIGYPPSGNLEELEPVLREHTDSHGPAEFMQTIGILQDALLNSHMRVRELEAALRGANLIMQSNGLLPPPPGTRQPDLPEGLILPVDADKTIHVAKERKHGDIVPGKGKLVGKKITDPMVLRDLKKGQNGRGNHSH